MARPVPPGGPCAFRLRPSKNAPTLKCPLTVHGHYPSLRAGFHRFARKRRRKHHELGSHLKETIMTAIRTLLLGAALGGALVLSAPAVAADLGDYGSMKDDMSITDVSMARFYIRADLSHAWMRESGMTERLFGADWEMTDTSIANTWAAGGGLGWYMTPNFRADITVDYHRNAEARGSVYIPVSAVPAATPDMAGDWDATFNVQSTALLANFYYDFGARHDFNPYIGVGLGWAFNKTSGGSITDPCDCNTSIDGDDQTNFAWALMAGVTKNIGNGFNMDFGYRYLDMGGAHTGNMIDKAGAEVPDTDPVVDDITAHEVRIGLRYDIY
jgi:opacity protein-like surface antigen